MKEVLCDDQLLIWDDVLPAATFEELWKTFRNGSFRSVHSEGMEAVFRVSDGNPLVGREYAWTPRPVEEMLPPGLRRDELGLSFHPTHGPADAVIDAILSAAERARHLTGTMGKDWLALNGSFWAYPAGTGLSWHTDAVRYSCAFIYYCHRRWDVAWGGELLVSSSTQDAESLRGAKYTFDESESENRVLMREGLGRYVLPKPNRLVLLKGGIPHRLSPVQPGAGNNVRASLAGFFVSPKGIELMLEAHLARGAPGKSR